MLKDKELKIGILGFTEGNGHPYSWSAMFNGYDPIEMQNCGFPVIPEYLNKQPKETIGIKGAKITHICCTGFKGIEEARKVAKATFIEKVVERPEEMIGEVDAVICATDVGDEHVERCKPFLDANIPMFIDKPLINSEEDLKTFVKWRKEGKKFISCSSLRFNKSLEPLYKNHYEFGKLMFICQPMAKKFETYGIHALEGVFPLLGEGFVSVRNTGTYEQAHLHIKHKSGCNVTIAQGIGMSGAGTLIVGTAGSTYVTNQDSYYCFKKQLDLFVEWLRTGVEPFPFTETIELMKMVIAGIKSREEGGKEIFLKDISID